MDDIKVALSRPYWAEGIGSLITYARELRGLGQGKLAAALRIPQTRLHRYENGLSAPKPEELSALCELLSVPMSFWGQPTTLSVEPCWRCNKTMLVGERKRITRLGKRLRDTIARITMTVEVEPSLPWHSFEPSDFDGTDEFIGESIADELRVLWSIPSGPIRNLTEYAEAAGFFVHLVNFGNDQVDGFTWPTFEPKVILLANGRPGCRRRMSLAHEIGHHAMGHLTEHKSADTQAKSFASALLLPADDFEQTWPTILSIDSLTRLKRHWGVSIQALLYRARSMGIITERVYYNWVVDFSRTGRRTNEPGYIEPENPSLIAHMIRLVADQLVASLDNLADAYYWTPSEFHTFFGTPPKPSIIVKPPIPSDSAQTESTDHVRNVIQMPNCLPAT